MVSSIVGPAGTLLGTLLGFLGALVLQTRAARAAKRQRLADLSAETLAAIGELQTALESYKVQWRDWSAHWPVLAVAVTELMASDPGVWRRGRLAAIRTASQFRRDRDEAARAALTAPTARLMTALIQVSLADDKELRVASHALREAVGTLIQSFGPARSWNRAKRDLDAEVSNFRAVVDLAVTKHR